MKHLTDTEFVDLIEDADLLPSDRRRHAASCEDCRAQADALSAMLAQTAGDVLPEPSPLYWDHFSARVGDAVRGELPAPAAPAWVERFRSPLVAWAAAAALAVLIMMTVVWRATLHAPSRGRVAPELAQAPQTLAVDPVQVASAVPGDNVEADEAWAVVRTAAEGLAWEDAHAVGLSAHPGSAEGIALELTAEERAELGRLLDTEMKRSGCDDRISAGCLNSAPSEARRGRSWGWPHDNHMTRHLPFVAALLAATTLAASGQAAVQRREPLPPEERPNRPAGLSPGEVVAMLDAYAVVQAQDALSLNDAQYGQFVTRLRRLQEARRRNQQARNQILQELRKLAGAQATPPFDENGIRDRLKALRDHDDRAAAELRRAYDALDEVLDVRQQARFRTFEEMLERRKLDLLMRARQGAARRGTSP